MGLIPDVALLDGVHRHMFASRGVPVWFRGSANYYDEIQNLGEDATTQDMFRVSGFDKHRVAKAALVADPSGEIMRLLGLGDLAKMDAKTLRRVLGKIQEASMSVESHELVYRANDGHHLSVMGKGYTPVQVREAFSVLDSLVESGDVQLITIGSLNDGKKTFMTAKLTGVDEEVVPGDVLSRYLVVRDSYDGSTTLDYAAATTAIVCENTERIAFGEAKRSGRLSKQKHTKGILSETRVAQAREALGIAQLQFDRHMTFARVLSKIAMPDAQVEDFHQRLVFGADPIPGVIDRDTTSGQRRRMLAELGFLYQNGKGQDLKGRKGTAWGAYSAVTEYTTHVKRHKSGTDADRTNFVMFGKGHDYNLSARNLMVEQHNIALS
jgi:phage/plasmid-like protein (TIGR03299 family)